VTQDEDVLDTWFSSALWPFSTLGWPEKTADLRDFYPTSVLVTAYDIITFWVSKMIFMGLFSMEQIPFPDVFIHGLVRDAQGRKMSKSLGNGMDPLDAVEKYGADALRFALATGNSPGNDMRFSEEKLEAARNFNNKIWNAARFLFLNMERAGIERWAPEKIAITENAPLEDRWIFSRLRQCAEQVNRAQETYRYHEAAQTLWEFFWHEFCDWYVELKKLRFREASGLTDDWRNVLTVFEAALRLLHPVMPFITEELWQRITEGAPDRAPSIAVSQYPEIPESLADAEAEEEMRLLQETITAARNLRSENKIDPKQKVGVVLATRGAALKVARAHAAEIEALARIGLDVREAAEDAPAFQMRLDVAPAQIEARRQRLEKEIEQLEKVIANSERQLSNESFTSRAPAAVVDSMRAKLEDYRTQVANKRAALGDLSAS